MSNAIRQIKDSQIFQRRFSDFHDVRFEYTWKVTLGKIGNRDWVLNLRTHSNFLMMHLSPCSYSGWRIKKWQYLMCVVNEDPSKNVEIVDKNCEATEVSYQQFIRLDEMLAENSGFLIGGEFRVRIEIRVLSFLDVCSGFNMFNFFDPFENCVTFKTQNRLLYANKHVILTHCGRLRNLILDGQTEFSVSDSCLSWYDVNDVLQWIHGFQGFRYCDSCRASFYEETMFRLSVHWGIPIHHWYTERMYNQDLQPFYKVIYINRRMKNELKTVNSLKNLKNHVQHLKLKKLNEETRKAIIQKFFSFAIESNKITRVKRAKNMQRLQEIVKKWKLDDLDLRLMVKVADVFFSFRYNVEGTKSWEEMQKQTRRWNVEELKRKTVKKVIQKCFSFAIDYRAVALGSK